MADTNEKPKFQLRNGISVNGVDKTPSPSTKLLISHGKPNFTIQRSPKVQQNGDTSPLTAEIQNNKNNNYNPYKTAEKLKSNNNNDIVVQSTKFNGVFKPANVPVNEGQQSSTTENEAAKVVLRRAKVAAADTPLKEGEDELVPEFIRRQRRIQERLAKENVLDFENRRSGYFTHVMITPTSPNRTSFVETMSSPAIVPSLEIPPPAAHPQHTKERMIVEEDMSEEVEQQQVNSNGKEVLQNGHNGHVVDAAEAEAEEVARAIEEVNKAVAGEDDDKSGDVEVETPVAITTTSLLVDESPAAVHVEPIVAVTTLEHIEEPPTPPSSPITPAVAAVETQSATPVEAAVTVATIEHAEEPKQNGHAELEVSATQTPTTAQQNGHAATNGNEGITISHTNGMAGPHIPSPDPSGALGVNYEPKTVVSFSKDLGSEVNKYPDTVKVVRENGEGAKMMDEDLQEMAKLKFDIKGDDTDVQVTSVLRTE